jgi:hypothetical protein
MCRAAHGSRRSQPAAARRFLRPAPQRRLGTDFESSGSRILAERIERGGGADANLDLNGPVAPQDLPTLPSAVPTLSIGLIPGIYGVDAFYPASPVMAGEPVRQGDGRILPVRVFPFQYNPVTRQLRYHPDLLITVRCRIPGRDGSHDIPPHRLLQPTTLPGDGVLRVHTRERGFYRLTYDDLSAAGVEVGPGGENPNSFAVYYKGQPVDIMVTGADDNSFDPGDLVIFYAVPYDGGRYQNYNVYQFVYGDNITGRAWRRAPGHKRDAASLCLGDHPHLARRVRPRLSQPLPTA